MVVDNLLMTPEGLAIDYKAQKLYWADSRIGTAGGRIESIDLDGKNRQTVVEKNTMQPFGLAVDEEAIYWTDTNNKALYKLRKGREMEEPIKLSVFSSMPMGLVANNHLIKEMPDCKLLEIAIKEYKEEKKKEPEQLHLPDELSTIDCLNGGELLGNYCNCPRGFAGQHCEISVCQNLCLNGDCYMSSIGKAICRCDRGFIGERCQKNICDGFCLNGGVCTTHTTREIPRCQCQENFLGERCEVNGEFCDIYCLERRSDNLVVEKYEKLCR